MLAFALFLRLLRVARRERGLPPALCFKPPPPPPPPPPLPSLPPESGWLPLNRAGDELDGEDCEDMVLSTPAGGAVVREKKSETVQGSRKLGLGVTLMNDTPQWHTHNSMQ